jgi:hypothetical protein
MAGLHLTPEQIYRRQYYLRNKKRCHEANARWRKKNPEKTAQYVRTYKARVGRTVLNKSRDAAKLKLAGRPKPIACEVCGNRGKICFDHDHGTNKFRGWLCEKCNLAIGQGRDDPKLLRLLAQYLEKNSS